MVNLGYYLMWGFKKKRSSQAETVINTEATCKEVKNNQEESTKLESVLDEKFKESSGSSVSLKNLLKKL